MEFLVYLGIGLLATVVSAWEKRINVAVAVAPISIPFGILTAAGASIALIVMFKLAILLGALVLLLLAKLKAFIGAKIAAIFGSMAAAALGIALGPITWFIAGVAMIIFVVMLGAAIKEAFVGMYLWFFEKMAMLLMAIRRRCDAARSVLPRPLKFLVLIIEVPLVCGLSVYGLWQTMDYFDGSTRLTDSRLLARIASLAPFVLVTFRAYRRDTTPPGSGGDGPDFPKFVEATDAIKLLPPMQCATTR